MSLHCLCIWLVEFHKISKLFVYTNISGGVNPNILFYFTSIIFFYLLFVLAIVVEFIFLNSTKFVWSNLVLF